MKALFSILFIFAFGYTQAQVVYVKSASTAGGARTVCYPNGSIIVGNTTANTTTAASLLVSQDTLAASEVKVGSSYHFELLCTITTPTVSIPTVTFTLSLGTSTVNFTNGLGLLGGFTNLPFRIMGEVAVKGATAEIVNVYISQNNGQAIQLTQSNMTPLSTFTNNMSIQQFFNIKMLWGGFSLGTANITPIRFTRWIE